MIILTGYAPSVWVIQRKGFKGDLNASLGVAERLTTKPRIISVEDIEEAGGILNYLKKGVDRIALRDSDFPDVVIASSAVASSVNDIIKLKHLSHGRTYTVFLRDPKSHHRQFDLIVMPEHQAKSVRSNTIACTGIAHRVTSQLMQEGLATWENQFSAFDGMKKIGVMIGGDCIAAEGETGEGKLTVEDGIAIGRELNAIAKQHNAALLITNSQRTPEDAWQALCSQITDVPAYLHHYKLDAARGNPYFGLLAAADILVPTADSMSMCSECCSTGKPVFIAGMHCHNVRSDHRRLAEQLFETGHARPLERHFEDWPVRPAPLDTAGDIANVILEHLRSRPLQIA